MTTHQKNLHRLAKKYNMDARDVETIHNAVLKLKELDQINCIFIENDPDVLQLRVGVALELCEEIDEVEKLAELDAGNK